MKFKTPTLPTITPKHARIAGSAAAGIATGYTVNKLSWLTHYINGTALDKATGALANAQLAFANPLPSLSATDLMWGLCAGAAVSAGIWMKIAGKRKFRDGEEYGSAKWSKPEDFSPFADKSDPFHNIIFTATERKNINTRTKNPKFARNNNVIVEGASGTGKTRSVIEPNLLQASPGVSYVVTDTKGSILPNVGSVLAAHGFRICVVDLIDLRSSSHYNPLAYVRNEKDVLKLVNVIMENTKGEGDKSGEDFWVKCERMLLSAYIAYVVFHQPDGQRNMSCVLDLIDRSSAREEDEDYQSEVDKMFEHLEATDKDCFALRQYKKYKLASGKTAKSILISVGARMAPFDIDELRDMMEYDELALDMIGDKATALFVQTSDNDRTFDFVSAMIYSQMFNLLIERADRAHGGRLPRHVMCLLDEFCNIHVPNFERLIATIRSREISTMIVVQNMSQLKGIYKDHAPTIVGNCDTRLFLGGRDPETLKEIAEVLGRQTIDIRNESDTRGSQQSYGQNFQRTGRELMTKDELAILDNNECILMVRGLRPFKSRKFDITRHPRYRYHAEANPKCRYVVSAPSIKGETYQVELDEEYLMLEGELPPM